MRAQNRVETEPSNERGTPQPPAIYYASVTFLMPKLKFTPRPERFLHHFILFLEPRKEGREIRPQGRLMRLQVVFPDAVLTLASEVTLVESP